MITEEYLDILNRYINEASENMSLRSGTEREAINMLENSNSPFRIGMDLQELFLRCGGSGGNDMFLGSSDFMSPKDCLADYAQIKSLCSEIGIAWPDALFPIGSTQCTTLVLLRQDEFTNSEIYMFYPASGDMTIYSVYDSLSELFKALLHKNIVAERKHVRPTYDLAASKLTTPKEWYRLETI